MTKIINIVYSLVSVLTLSGLSEYAKQITALYPPAVAALCLLLWGPWKLLKKEGITEALIWGGIVALCALFTCFIPESGRGTALLLMLVGGCEGSLAGGFRAGPFLNSLRLMKRSIVLKAHPNAIVSLRRDKAPLSIEKASDDSFNVILYLAIHLILSFFLCFGMSDFSEAMLLTAAALGNNGWVLLLFTDVSPGTLLGSGARIYLCFVMLLGRALLIHRCRREKRD